MRPGDASEAPDRGPRIPPRDHARRQAILALSAAAADADGPDGVRSLCRACIALLAMTGASISLASGGGAQALLAASDTAAAHLAEAQYTLGDGPCHSALRQAAPVFASDLTAGADARRWPVFAHEALRMGVRAVFSFPLGTGAVAIGTLDLDRSAAGPMSPRDLKFAFVARDIVTFAVLRLTAAAEADDGGIATWLDAAEADRDEVHQAVGMVMVQLGLDPGQALDRLRAHAFAEGRAVTEIARDVVARKMRLHD